MRAISPFTILAAMSSLKVGCVNATVGVIHGLRPRSVDRSFHPTSFTLLRGQGHATANVPSGAVDMATNGKTDQVSAPSSSRRTEHKLLVAWDFCVSSDQCADGCCSSNHSTNGKLKCTPLDGGFDSNICIVVTGGIITATTSHDAADIKNLTVAPRPSPPAPVTNIQSQTHPLRGDWATCSASNQCANGCCSSNHSTDGKLKCTPLDGGFDSIICVVETGGIITATTSHDAADIKNLTVAPRPSPPAPVTNIQSQTHPLRGDWATCSASNQCANGCCSSNHSTDGKLKCTPLDGGFDSNICIVADGGILTSSSHGDITPSNAPRPRTSTDPIEGEQRALGIGLGCAAIVVFVLVAVRARTKYGSEPRYGKPWPMDGKLNETKARQRSFIEECKHSQSDLNDLEKTTDLSNLFNLSPFIPEGSPPKRIYNY